MEKTYEIPYTFTLSSPIKTFNKEGDEVVDARVEKITFSNPLNAGMMANIPAGENVEITMGHFYPIISKMTGQPVATINKLGVSDLMHAVEVVGYFLEPGQ